MFVPFRAKLLSDVGYVVVYDEDEDEDVSEEQVSQLKFNNSLPCSLPNMYIYQTEMIAFKDC